MRSFVLSLVMTVAFAGAGFAQTTATGVAETKILRGVSKTKTTASEKPAVQKNIAAKSAIHHAAAAHQTSTAHQAAKPPVVLRGTGSSSVKTAAKSAVRQSTGRHVTPQSLRGSRYGGFAPSVPMEQPAEPPPQLDMTVPRSLSMTNVNTGESISVTYWSNGTYHRDALDKLNHFLRDTRTGEQTEMDPKLFDVLWSTLQITGFGGTVEVLSGFRSPESNAWLASVSSGVARDSQHMNGNAMDIRFPGVPVFKIRQAARSLQMGGVGFYPRSGFVHIDTGDIRYW
jgi:uncharacterized protein YcbK (DUF882 family)